MTKFLPGHLQSLQYNQTKMVYPTPRNREIFRKEKGSKRNISGKQHAFHAAEVSDAFPLQLRPYPGGASPRGLSEKDRSHDRLVPTQFQLDSSSSGMRGALLSLGTYPCCIFAAPP